MTEEAKTSMNLPELYKTILFTPHIFALLITWLLVTIVLVLMLVGGVRNTNHFRIQEFEKLWLPNLYGPPFAPRT